MSVRATIREIRKGFPFERMQQFATSSGMAPTEVAKVLQIPARTLARRRKEGRLAPDESERLVRLDRLFDLTVQLFDGDRDRAREWFTKPRPALGNESPLQFAETEIGAREVENLIGRLEHGIYT